LVVALLGLLAWTPMLGASGQVEIATTPRISVDDLKKLLDADKAIVLDVRGKSSYEAGHIAGALLVPLETVAARAAEWKTTGKTIVTYCS
jgi:rhodanese-related sulfurtransferase